VATAADARELLDLGIEFGGIFLQFGDVRIAAACQVEPEVSSERSMSMTSVQPSLVRW
jgi:hypothetical protein